MIEDISEKVLRFVEYIKNSVNCQCPAQIDKVNDDGTVDIIVFRNDEIDNAKIPHVKIKHLESGRAFIHLGVAEGDYGVVKYFDRNIQDYLDGQVGYNYDTRSHDTNDACFELGFVPNPSTYIFPSGEVTIGSKTGSALITINGDNINIKGGNISINGSNVTINGNTTIDGKKFLQHQHSNGNQGANTGAVV